MSQLADNFLDMVTLGHDVVAKMLLAPTQWMWDKVASYIGRLWRQILMPKLICLFVYAVCCHCIMRRGLSSFCYVQKHAAAERQ